MWHNLKGSGFNSANSDGQDNGGSSAEQQKKKQDYLWFKTQADEVLSDIEAHINELLGLRVSAESTSDSLDNLLGLMQQQASALQAWQSARQAEETVK